MYENPLFKEPGTFTVLDQWINAGDRTELRLNVFASTGSCGCEATSYSALIPLTCLWFALKVKYDMVASDVTLLHSRGGDRKASRV